MASKTATVEKPPVEVLSSVNLTWQSWESVAILLDNIPAGTNTFHLWKSFQSHGNIISIDIFEKESSRYGKGRIRFKYVFIIAPIHYMIISVY